MKQNAIDACSCVRNSKDPLTAPKCAPEMYVGDKEGSLFVKPPAKLFCLSARNFDYGDFCMCESRIQLFRNFGI
jgi:hypothetical protein